MKNILGILSVLAIFVGLSGCDDDDAKEWTPDSLTVSVSNSEAEPMKVGDGNWGVRVRPEFQGVFNVQIDTRSAWQASVEYITDEEEDWLALSGNEGNGTGTLELTVNANRSIVERKAFLSVRTLGDVPVERKLTVIQTDSDPIIEFTPEEGIGTYDSGSKTLSVGYVGNTYNIGFWSNVEKYELKIVPEGGKSGEVEWVSGFQVKDGAISFATGDNLSGDVRSACIVFESEEEAFCDTCTLTQGKSLYRNVLLSVDGVSEEAEYAGKEYSIAGHEVKLLFDSDQALTARIVDPATNSEAGWAEAEVNGTEVTVSFGANAGGESRQARLEVKAGGTSYEAQPPVTWSFSQLQEKLDVTAEQRYMRGDKMVLGPGAKSASNPSRVASCETTDDEVTVTSTEEWVRARVDGGEVLLEMDENSTGSPREASLTLKNANGVKSSVIGVEQRAEESADSPRNWSIEAGNDHTDEYVSGSKRDLIKNIIDGDPMTRWQWKWNSGGKSDFPNTPYEFVIDFGSPRLFNSIKVWQVQQSDGDNGYVKDIQFKAGNDDTAWPVDLGTYSLGTGNAQIQQEIKTGDGSHFIPLPGIYEARYVRIVILSNFKGIESKVNNSKNAYLAEFDAFLE